VSSLSIEIHCLPTTLGISQDSGIMSALESLEMRIGTGAVLRQCFFVCDDLGSPGSRALTQRLLAAQSFEHVPVTGRGGGLSVVGVRSTVHV
jgi:hypothetical protein